MRCLLFVAESKVGKRFQPLKSQCVAHLMGINEHDMTALLTTIAMPAKTIAIPRLLFLRRGGKRLTNTLISTYDEIVEEATQP